MRGRLLLPGLLATPCSALAHAPGATARSSAEAIALVVLLGLPAIAYVAGEVRLVERTHRRGRGAWGLRPLSFAAGWLTLLLCLVSRLDDWSAQSFAAHMSQHELLMLVAAPLLVAAHPLPTMLWGLPRALRAGIGRLSRRGPVRNAWTAITGAAAGWTLHAAALWVWHVPAIFQAALRDRAVHDLQHASFLLSALLFWVGLFATRRGNRGLGAVYLFTTTLHTGALGALITFASVPWYLPPLHELTLLDPLTDQQLGGLIMWVPGSLVYVTAGLWLLALWVRDAGSIRPGSPTAGYNAAQTRGET